MRVESKGNLPSAAILLGWVEADLQQPKQRTKNQTNLVNRTSCPLLLRYSTQFSIVIANAIKKLL